MDHAMRNNRGNRFTRRRGAGLTLLELVVVVTILAILVTAIVPLTAHFSAESKVTATNASLTEIRNAIMGTPGASGYFGDTGQLPTTLKDLFVNPFSSGPLATFNRDTNLGWHGPYLVSGGMFNSSGNLDASFLPTNGGVRIYGNDSDPAILDAWGHPIVLQISNQGPPPTPAANIAFARLVSAGQNGVLDTPQNPSLDAYSNPYPSSSSRGDDLVLFINHSDSDP